MGIEIEELTKRHNRSAFDCGTECLNTYLQNTALQHTTKGGSKTFVLIDSDNPFEILGYFTMTICSVDLATFPEEWARRYSKGPSPYALLLARLAVATALQRKGLGELMIVEALKRAQILMDWVGGWGLFVDAKDAEAASYYEKYGFRKLAETSDKLFISIAEIRTLRLTD